MASVNISLSEQLKKFVLAQVRSGAYGNVSEYFRSLIREHQKRAAQERLELLLLEGIQSGSGGPMTTADWDALRKVATSRAENQNSEPSANRTQSKQDPSGPERPGRNRRLLRRRIP